MYSAVQQEVGLVQLYCTVRYITVLYSRKFWYFLVYLYTVQYCIVQQELLVIFGCIGFPNRYGARIARIFSCATRRCGTIVQL